MSGNILHWMLPVKHQMILIELEAHRTGERRVRVDGVERVHARSEHREDSVDKIEIHEITIFININWYGEKRIFSVEVS
ncbi:hypothetical protein CAEBREN_23773 [Caenorhabditis brenneri]|uniref:Uncharacterized protein n=1 Tax=Caenorhabditis brenneri TaxID=135651 RepID=G0MWQ0_CAEBE|nr:hypothetical protein CAEBREN_23773 [Caenorhabditis brenneri]